MWFNAESIYFKDYQISTDWTHSQSKTYAMKLKSYNRKKKV